jgi:imidazoleglycerol phosphate dehydratase HisB
MLIMTEMEEPQEAAECTMMVWIREIAVDIGYGHPGGAIVVRTGLNFVLVFVIVLAKSSGIQLAIVALGSLDLEVLVHHEDVMYLWLGR